MACLLYTSSVDKEQFEPAAYGDDTWNHTIQYGYHYEEWKEQRQERALEAVSYTHLDVYKRQVYTYLAKRRSRYKLITLN